MSYQGREVFAYAPLSMVTLEFRLNYEPALNGLPARDVFAGIVRSRFPILEQAQTVDFTFQNPGQPMVPEASSQLRAFTANRDAFAVVHSEALVITVTGQAYDEFANFLPDIATCLDGVVAAAPQASVQRVGLRYINEVRVPEGIQESGQWRRYIHGHLLGSVDALASARVIAVRGSSVFERENEASVNFNWGEAQGKSILSADFPLVRPEYPETRFFVLDIDSFREFSGYENVSKEALLEVVEDLHEPVGHLFQWALTDDLRSVFRAMRPE